MTTSAILSELGKLGAVLANLFKINTTDALSRRRLLTARKKALQAELDRRIPIP